MPVGTAYRRDIMRALRMVYSFGVDADIVMKTPARRLRAPAQARSERILPFESWEVERVAEKCGRWGASRPLHGRHRRKAVGGR
jgi:hypothetical protein